MFKIQFGLCSRAEHGKVPRSVSAKTPIQLNGITDYIKTSLAAVLISSGLSGVASAAVPKYQADCQPTFNLPEYLTELRDQDRLSWCYAFAGAELLSAYAGESLSAAHIAIAMNASMKDQSDRLDESNKGFVFPRGGFLEDALAAIFDRGGVFCRESDLPSGPMTVVTEDPKTRTSRSETYSLERRLAAILNISRLKRSPIRFAATPLSRTFANLIEPEITSSMELELPDGDKNGSLRLRALAEANCSSTGWRAPFGSERVRTERLTTKGLDAIVNQGAVAVVRMPVARVLRRATAQEKRVFAHSQFLLEVSSGDHEMLLTGRRWNQSRNRCEYVFKNSWGTVTRRRFRTVGGYTYIPARLIDGVRRGTIISIDAPVTWKNAKPAFEIQSAAK